MKTVSTYLYAQFVQTKNTLKGNISHLNWFAARILNYVANSSSSSG